MKINFHKLITLILIFSIFTSRAVDYFWVGNTGTWSDLGHWASTSGGTGGAFGALPTTGDNVFFDGNSFSIAGQTVTVDIDGSADDLSFIGVTNTPTFEGDAGFDLDIGGDLTLVAAMSHDFDEVYNFVSTTAQIITAAGQVFDGNLMFDGVGGSWQPVGALTVSGEIGLRNGTFDMNGQNITTGSINTNNGTAVRTIDFTTSTVVITNNGTALDLRGNTTNMNVIPGTATIEFTATGNITVQVGDEIKTIPGMTFSATTNTVLIRTGGTEVTTKRITFGPIVLTQDGVNFTVDGNNDDSNTKTFESITLPNDCRYIIGSADGTGGFSGTDNSIISGDFIVGNEGEGDVRGRYLDFQGDFIAGTETDCRFISSTEWQGDFTVGSSGGAHLILDQDARFNSNMNFNGNAIVRIDQDFDVSGNVVVADAAEVVFNGNGASSITTVLGSLLLGVESIFESGNGGVGLFTYNEINMGSEAQILFNNAGSLTSINDLILTSYNIVRFNTAGNNNITGTITSTGSCDIWLWLKSLTDGTAADVTFSSPQTVNTNICQDINCTSSNLTNTGGVDLANNTGITFTAPVAGTTFFWVGSTTGNTKTGTFTTGINDDWSNPDNWSLTSGSYSGSNSCIPGAQDDVVFNAASFSAGAGTVNLDLIIQACNSLTWTAIPAGCTIDEDLTTTNREFIIFGNLTLHSNVDNQFESLTTFSAHDSGTRSITSDGSNFFGAVDFEFATGTWAMLDDFDMNGEERADVTFRSGTVLANGVIWTIEDDWTVLGGTFTAGSSRIEFDGPAANNSRQEITTNGDSFFDLYINRGTNGGGANDYCRTLDPITINRDLNIIRGGLDDFGNQITGSATGFMDVENNARLFLARDDVATLFPTNYVTANIDMNESSRTYYNSDIPQIVSNVPDYGSIYLQNVPGGGVLAEKTMDGPISVTNLIFINDWNNLIDNGFQITGDAGEEIQMEPNSQLTLGTAASSTVFPTNHTVFDIREPSTVVYNSGLDQAIKGIAGASNARYWHVIVNNAAGAGVPLKTLDGDMIIRGDLTINTGNEVDVDALANHSIELKGNWTNSGDFVEREGLVSYTGTAGQTLISGGTIEDFYNFTVNNSSAAGVIIEDDISAATTLTFIDGIIYRGISGTEVVRIPIGAAVTGASNASFVDGQVEKIGNTAFDFPVGKNELYRPIIISAPSIAGTGFIAEYFQVDPDPTYDDGALEVPLELISSCEYWILDRSNAVTGNASVTLTWSAATSCGIVDISELRVARWDGALWRNEGNGGTTGDPSSGSLISAAAVTAFSPFTLGSTTSLNPLPIDLLSFEAVLLAEVVHLDWVTASEINNDFFTVERSADGVNFKPLFEVDGAGTSSEEINYEGKDRNPLYGISYYRLKQTDFDGAFEYSDVRTIEYLGSELVVYPNPAGVGSTIELIIPSELEEGTVNIYNAHGQIVAAYSALVGQNTLSIDELAAGVYYVQFNNASTTKVVKLVVK